MIDSQLINVRSTTFNLPSLTRFSTKMDAGRLAEAVFRAAQNHPALGVSKNVILIAAAMLALREYCGKTAIRVNFLTGNRMESWLQNTVGLVFKIFPVAAELNLFPTGESLLREVSRQITECFANSVCNYSTEENIPLRDALLINFLFGTDAESEMQEFDGKNIPLANERRVAAAARFDIYVEDRSGSVQMMADYQKNAYRPGSAKKFMDMLAGHLTTFVQAD